MSRLRGPRVPAKPVISVDTKKKERIGKFKNGGTDYRSKGKPRHVNVHDFEDNKLGKVVPYGIYDVTANAGFVSVGITSDTAEFAVQSMRCWRGTHGTAALSTGARADDHGRLRRLERGVRAAVEGRAAEARQRDPARHPCPALSPGAHRSGTRLSAGCSATSSRTGAAGHSPIALPSSS
jgi:hypothetical protein